MSYNISPQLQFKRKLNSLNKEQLAELLERLKAEEAPLGMVIATAKAYGQR